MREVYRIRNPQELFLAGSEVLVQVLRYPPEPLSVALTLEHGAHEQLKGPTMQLSLRHLALPCCLPVQTENLPEFVLAGCARPVNLVAEDEDGTAGQLLIRQQGVQLNLALSEPCPVAAVHQEDNSVHCGKVVLPHPSGLVMATQVKSGEPDPIDGQLL